jgi:hypothetical protein
MMMSGFITMTIITGFTSLAKKITSTIYYRTKEMIKIGKKPHIAQHEDKWGQPLGTYYVNTTAGYVDEEFWKDLQLYENYSKTPEGEAEKEYGVKQLKDGVDPQELDLPIMRRLIGRANALLWQFNMQLTDKDDCEDWIRSYALWDEPTLHEWTDKDDEEVKKLQAKCDELNG